MALRRIAESDAYAIEVVTDDATGEALEFLITNATKSPLTVAIAIGTEQPIEARAATGETRVACPLEGLVFAEKGVKPSARLAQGFEYRIDVDGAPPRSRAIDQS